MRTSVLSKWVLYEIHSTVKNMMWASIKKQLLDTFLYWPKVMLTPQLVKVLFLLCSCSNEPSSELSPHEESGATFFLVFSNVSSCPPRQGLILQRFCLHLSWVPFSIFQPPATSTDGNANPLPAREWVGMFTAFFAGSGLEIYCASCLSLFLISVSVSQLVCLLSVSKFSLCHKCLYQDWMQGSPTGESWVS